MLSGWYPLTTASNMKANMVADGLYHLVCLVFVLIGIALLVRAAPESPLRRGRCAFGWMLAG